MHLSNLCRMLSYAQHLKEQLLFIFAVLRIHLYFLQSFMLFLFSMLLISRFISYWIYMSIRLLSPLLEYLFLSKLNLIFLFNLYCIFSITIWSPYTHPSNHHTAVHVHDQSYFRCFPFIFVNVLSTLALFPVLWHLHSAICNFSITILTNNNEPYSTPTKKITGTRSLVSHNKLLLIEKPIALISDWIWIEIESLISISYFWNSTTWVVLCWLLLLAYNSVYHKAIKNDVHHLFFSR